MHAFYHILWIKNIFDLNLKEAENMNSFLFTLIIILTVLGLSIFVIGGFIFAYQSIKDFLEESKK